MESWNTAHALRFWHGRVLGRSFGGCIFTIGARFYWSFQALRDFFFIFAERWQLRARSGRRQGKNSLRLAVAVGTPPRQSCRKSKTYNIFFKLVFFFQNIVLFIFYIKSAEFLYYRLGNRSQLILPVKLLSIIRSKLRYVTTSTNQTWHLHATCSNPSLSSVHSIFMNEADVLSTFIGLAMSRM